VETEIRVEETPSLDLLERWRTTGDQAAAAEICARYVGRLIGLARARISRRLARRLDPEDIVQSVCRSLFVGVHEGRVELRPGTSLWQLLSAITLRKVFGRVEYHLAAKRSPLRESLPEQADSVLLPGLELIARDPTPDEVAALEEELAHTLEGLLPLHQRMVKLRLAGYTQQEIAAQTGRTERLVRLVLREFGNRLRTRLAAC
jgi:DNA-directed RNA polymerase specialized sigma24 family protein